MHANFFLISALIGGWGTSAAKGCLQVFWLSAGVSLSLTFRMGANKSCSNVSLLLGSLLCSGRSLPVHVPHASVKTLLESLLTINSICQGPVTGSDERGRALQCKYLKSRQLQEKSVSGAAPHMTMQGEQRELPVSNITAGSGSWLGKSSFSCRVT